MKIAKHWLHNHLEGAEIGGVANFYTSAPYGMPTLPLGTPEAGKYVVTSWGGANHGLTISGYHDSICWDYNNDGQYTNDIDLNNDGEITPMDWEIGGFRFANTYSGGPSFGNNGFSYMTYKSAADPYGGGGIWDNAIHVVYAKADCSPQLTARVTLKHSCRNQIRVRVGASTDQTSESPDFIVGLPVFDFHGGCQYMQGGTSNEDHKTIEFGLDLSPLLNLVGTNTPARYFLLVDEDDPNNWSTGEIVQFSIIDYTNGINEIDCGQNNVTLNQNSLTKLWVDHTLSFNQVNIDIDTFPPATVFEPYSANLQAINGSEPYVWDYDLNYTETNTTETFPLITAQQINPGSNYTTKTIDFPFPFAGEEFTSLKIYQDGYIMLGDELSWVYQVYDFLKFTKNKIIAPFMGDLNIYTSSNDGVWYDGDTTSAIFRWQISVDGYQNTSQLNFAVQIFNDGNIKFYYGEINDYPEMDWISGISSGDNIFYQFTELSNNSSIPLDYVCNFEATHYPKGFVVSRDGVFSGLPNDAYENFPIKFMVIDENNIKDSREVYFSTDGSNYLVIDDYWIWANGDEVIEFGETVVLSVDIKNLGEEMIYGAEMEISTDDDFIIFVDSTEILGDFAPEEVITFTGAFQFDVSNQIPNEHEIVLNTLILDDIGEDWASHISLTAFAPDVYAGGVFVDDGGNGGLDPGETTDITVSLYNSGGAAANNIITTLSSIDPNVTINNNISNAGNINANSSGEATFNITATDDIPIGYILELGVDIEADNDYTSTSSVYLIAGLISEGFESGNFSAYPWAFSGEAEWIIDNSTFYEGNYSASSGDIGDEQSSAITLEVYVLNDGEIKFFKKVSSEGNYDYLRFYIDGIEKGAWDGEQDWSEVAFNINEGLHTLTWSYDKDYSVSNGSDCGWVDYITFPPFGDPNPQLSYDPESFIFTIANEIKTDTIALSNEGTGPLIYSISAIDTTGNSSDWLMLDIENGGLNPGNSDEVYIEFDATNLEEGNYIAYVVIVDHLENEYIIPVYMLVDIGTGIQKNKTVNRLENIPNPFNRETNIHFTLEGPEVLTLKIYDFTGALVKTLLADATYPAGNHSINWDGKNNQGNNVNQGIYFYKLRYGNTALTRKMILLK